MRHQIKPLLAGDAGSCPDPTSVLASEKSDGGPQSVWLFMSCFMGVVTCKVTAHTFVPCMMQVQAPLGTGRERSHIGKS
jgi:hypothetical protein